MLVVKNDAAEVTIDAVVEVEHVVLRAEVFVFNCTARDDIAGDREGGTGVVPPWLGDDADFWWEIVVQGFREKTSHFIECLS